MPATGFSPAPIDDKEELRNASDSLDDVAQSLLNFAECLKKQDLGMADHHLRAAELHAAEAKHAMAVRQTSNQTANS